MIIDAESRDLKMIPSIKSGEDDQWLNPELCLKLCSSQAPTDLPLW